LTNHAYFSVAVHVLVGLVSFEVGCYWVPFDYRQCSAKFLESLFGERVGVLVRMQLFGQFFEVSIGLLSLQHLKEPLLQNICWSVQKLINQVHFVTVFFNRIVRAHELLSQFRRQ
jgi:hypothetical protein